MPRNLIPGDLTIKSVKAGDPRKRLGDGDGLYLLLFVKGAAHGWRFDYTHEATRKTISLGTYPDTGLKLAREKADAARQKVAAGIDPSAARKADHKRHLAKKAAEAFVATGEAMPGSFGAIYQVWLAKGRLEWSETYADKVEARMKKHILNTIGPMPVEAVPRSTLRLCLEAVQQAGHLELAHSLRKNCSQVFDFAQGIADDTVTVPNPAHNLSRVLVKADTKHMAAITEPKEFAALLKGIAEYDRNKGDLKTKIALTMAALTFQRPFNIYAMEWTEIDLASANPAWTIPSVKMKRKKIDKQNGRPHLVPLAPQAVQWLRELHPITGDGKFVFPSLLKGGRCMSENTLNTAIRRMGFTKDEMVSHGFRASARTILCDHLDANPEVVEAQLAHAKSGPLGAAYDRAEYMQQRRALMGLWADACDALREGKTIEQFKTARAAVQPA
jgi:integrase